MFTMFTTFTGHVDSLCCDLAGSPATKRRLDNYEAAEKGLEIGSRVKVIGRRGEI
jgi:hypothetical protein